MTVERKGLEHHLQTHLGIIEDLVEEIEKEHVVYPFILIAEHTIKLYNYSTQYTLKYPDSPFLETFLIKFDKIYERIDRLKHELKEVKLIDRLLEYEAYRHKKYKGG